MTGIQFTKRGRANPFSAKGEQGLALVLAMIFLVVAASLVFTGTLAMKTNRVTAETWFRLYGQANAFAKAGLTETLSWYRRQSAQPVTSFNPQRDLTALPPLMDTDEPAIGLVREFEISGSLWGRYEVPISEVSDISSSRGLLADCGGVWLLLSRGYVFRRNSDSVPFNTKPNSVLARTHLTTEIRRFVLTPPAMAGIVASNGSNIFTNGPNSRVLGGSSPAIAYLRGTGTPTMYAGSTTGGTQLFPADPADPIPTEEEAFGFPAIFGGLSAEDIRSIADLVVENDVDFPVPVPPNSIVYADCKLIFNNNRPLKCVDGSAIVVVTGDVTVNNGSSPCYFSGFLYVTGNLSINAVSVIRGQVVARGNVHVSGTADTAEVEYDPGAIDSLLKEMGQYRISRVIFNPNSKE